MTRTRLFRTSPKDQIAPPSQKRVIFVTHTVFHYRQRFHEIVHDRLRDHGVDYRVLYGQPDKREAKKSDTVTVACGKPIHNVYLYPPGGRNPLIWQPAVRDVFRADLAILIQENRLLLNYQAQILRWAMRGKLALFGHGRNFQSRNPNGLSERWKRFWALRCDWWFGYTDETRRHIESLGFPPERITVFNNAVDTGELSRLAGEIDAQDVRAAQRAIGVEGDRVAVFVGGLYPDKRLEFLVDAADLVHARVPGFELVVVGGGVDRATIEALAADRPWLKVTGPRFGREKVALMMGAELFLMPGLVGLAVLDAAVLGLPIVTTDYPYHSPEIAYLREGGQGEIVPEWTSAEDYAEAVIALLNDDRRRALLGVAGRKVAEAITIDNMASRFAAGVLSALGLPGPAHP